MINYKRTKKRLIISYKNLSDELKFVFKDTYPDGYKEHLQKVTKPDGEPLFVVPLETEDTSYLVRFDWKIDTLQGEALENAMFNNDSKDQPADDDDYSPMADMSEAIEKDEGMAENHVAGKLNHGNYEDIADEMKSDKKRKAKLSELDELRNELKEAFEDDDESEYNDDFDADEDADEDDFEPTDEDLEDVADLLDDDQPKSKKSSTKKNSTKATKSTTQTKKTTTAKASKTETKSSARTTATSKAATGKTTAAKKTTKKKD